MGSGANLAESGPESRATYGSENELSQESPLALPSLSVIGLGYIGLPTAIAFARNGWNVTGVDVNQRAVDSINAGILPFEEEGMEEALQEVLAAGTFRAQTAQAPADVYIIAVPTPFHADKSADLSYIQAASEAVGTIVKEGDLVVLESTSPPRTTEKMAEWIKAVAPNGGEGVMFAHAPERVLPGRILIELTANDRVVGGLTPEATERTREVYATFCDGEIHTTDATTAEMSKLAENSFRDVNIAFANELSMISDRLGIDVWELINLANKHPRVNILQPGPGVGGHCIAVDPWFVVEAAPEDTDLIRTARKVNDTKPQWVIDKVRDALAEKPEAVISLFGLAFKPNIDDLRESPAVSIVAALSAQVPEAKLLVAEPHVSELPRKLADLDNVELVSTQDALEGGDIAVLLVDHNAFADVTADDLAGKLVIDTRGQWKI